MQRVERAKALFDRYGGMMRTSQLNSEKFYYREIKSLMDSGYIEKVKTGHYQWIDHENLSEAATVSRLFPDGILCMATALRHYGYIDRTPGEWNIAVDRFSNRTRFNLDYPFVKPYYVTPAILELGLCIQEIDGNPVRMYDKERTICDCMRYRNKMDKELFNKAVQSYVADPEKNVPKLLEYAEALRVKTHIKNLIGVWL